MKFQQTEAAEKEKERQAEAAEKER